MFSFMNCGYFLAVLDCVFSYSFTTGTLYKKRTPNQHLEGYSLDSVYVDNLDECSLLCEVNDDCYSFHFGKNSTTAGLSKCDLVYCTADARTALTSDTHMTYFGQVFPKNAVPLCNACLHVACQNGSYCVETGPYSPNFTCVAPINEDCGADPTFTGPTYIRTTDGRVAGVYCDQGWTYVFKRFDGLENFRRTRVEYQDGFGKPYTEHFIGLDNLASMLKQKSYKVRFDLTAWHLSTFGNLDSGYAEYSVFGMADDTDNYRLTIGGYSGTAGDSMTYHNGQIFSTYDQDYNGCASRYKVGWWFNSCHKANLFGHYADGATCPEYAKCMQWYHWPDVIASPDNHYSSLKEAAMKIHPV